MLRSFSQITRQHLSTSTSSTHFLSRTFTSKFNNTRYLSTDTTDHSTDTKDESNTETTENNEENEETATEDIEEVEEVEIDPEPSYDDKNPVVQGDTLYVRQRREFNDQLGQIRKDYGNDPTNKTGNVERNRKLRDVKIRQRTNKYRIKAILKPTAEELNAGSEDKRYEQERAAMMKRIEIERKSLKAKFGKIRKNKIRQLRNDRKEEETAIMTEMVLSGEYLTQEDQIDTWIARKLSNTSLQNMPEFVKEDKWGSWAAFEDEEGEEFLGRDGKEPQQYFFGEAGPQNRDTGAGRSIGGRGRK
tara:strand:+ start:1713 stop:2621 length:909 start_codon:yes stop_codon:yes gene_type:complete